MPMSQHGRSLMKHVIGVAIAAGLGVGAAASTTATVELTTPSASSVPVVNWSRLAQNTIAPVFPQYWGWNGVRGRGAVDEDSIDASAPTSAYSMDVPLAYYQLSFTLSKRTGGITP